jgi:hypothetical protein
VKDFCGLSSPYQLQRGEVPGGHVLRRPFEVVVQVGQPLPSGGGQDQVARSGVGDPACPQNDTSALGLKYRVVKAAIAVTCPAGGEGLIACSRPESTLQGV